MRRLHRSILGTAIIAAAGAGSAKAEAVVEYCPPYAEKLAFQDAEGPAFLPFDLHVVDVTGGRAIHVTGDELVVTREIVGSLVKTAIEADPSIKSVVLDARKLIVRSGLAFSGTPVTLLADEVRFEDGGGITLLPAPAATIEVFARKASFTQAYLPFDVRQREVAGGSDDFADIGKLLRVTAGEVDIDGTSVAPADALARLASLFTLSSIYDFTPKVDATLGPTALAQWEARSKQAARWPQFAVRLWRTEFAVNPFSRRTREAMRTRGARYHELFDAIAPAQATHDFRMMVGAAAQGTDEDGNGPAWATVEPLSEVLKTISQFEAQAGGANPRLDGAIAMMEAIRDQIKPDTAALASAASEEIDRITTGYDASTQRMLTIATEMEARSSRLDTLQTTYKDREDRLKQHAEDIQKDARNRAQIVSALATAASIATTAFSGSPQAGAAAGGLIYAVGQAAQGQDAWNSLSAGYQFASKIEGALKDTANGLKELGAARSRYASFVKSATISNITIAEYIEEPVKDPKPGQPTTTRISRDDALSDLGKKGETVGKGIQGAYKVYNDFIPQPSPVSAAVEADASLKDIALQIAAELEGIKTLTIEVEQLQRSSQEQQRELTGATERLAKLRAVEIDNEEHRRAALALATTVLESEFSAFRRATDQLRRLSLVEFRRELPVPAANFRRVLLAEQISSDFDPAKAATEKAAVGQYVAAAKSRRDYVVLLASRVRQASERQFKDYVQSRGTAPVVSAPIEEITSSSASPAAERRFIRQVNDLLEAQYKARNTPEFGTLTQRRLEVPFTISKGLSSGYPARLIQAVVDRVNHSGKLSGSDLVFTLEVERVGNLRVRSPDGSDADCFSIDLRSKTSQRGEHFDWRDRNIGDIAKGDAFLPTEAVSYWYIRPGDAAPSASRTMMVTYGPAEARMYLRLRIDPNAAWAKIPVVRSLSVRAEVFQ